MKIVGSAVDSSACLEARGYSRREAEFIQIVAFFSGHFVARQYSGYVGCRRGRVENLFLRRLQKRRHVRVTAARPRRYQLIGEEVYEEAGTTPGTHARRATLDKSARRILGLDFVLAHREMEFLPRVADKAAFFRDELGVAEERLPAAIFGGRRKVGGCRRVFPDGFPIFVERDADGRPRSIGFTYVCEGRFRPARLRRYLQRYRPLWKSLPVPLRLFFVATSPRPFRRAQDEFAKCILGGAALDGRESFREYCRIRQRFEAGDPTLEVQEYVTLSKGREHFRGEGYETAYREFCGTEERANTRADWSFKGFVSGPLPPVMVRKRGTLRCCHCSGVGSPICPDSAPPKSPDCHTYGPSCSPGEKPPKNPALP